MTDDRRRKNLDVPDEFLCQAICTTSESRRCGLRCESLYTVALVDGTKVCRTHFKPPSEGKAVFNPYKAEKYPLAQMVEILRDHGYTVGGPAVEA